MTERRPEQRNVYVGPVEEKQSSCWEVPLSLVLNVYVGLFADVKTENRAKRISHVETKVRPGRHCWPGSYWKGNTPEVVAETTYDGCGETRVDLRCRLLWSPEKLMQVALLLSPGCWKLTLKGESLADKCFPAIARRFHESTEVEGGGFGVSSCSLYLKFSHTKSLQPTTTSDQPMIPIIKGH